MLLVIHSVYTKGKSSLSVSRYTHDSAYTFQCSEQSDCHCVENLRFFLLQCNLHSQPVTVLPLYQPHCVCVHPSHCLLYQPHCVCVHPSHCLPAPLCVCQGGECDCVRGVNDFRFKMGSDVSHFNVSLIVGVAKSRDSVHITFLEERGEPKRGVEPVSFRLPAERLTTRPSWLAFFCCDSPRLLSISVRSFNLCVLLFSPFFLDSCPFCLFLGVLFLLVRLPHKAKPS